MPNFRKLPELDDLTISLRPFEWWRKFIPYVTGDNILLILDVVSRNGPEKPDSELPNLVKALTGQGIGNANISNKLTYNWVLYRWDSKEKIKVFEETRTFHYVKGPNQEPMVFPYISVGGKHTIEMEFSGPYFRINPSMKILTMSEFQVIEKDTILLRAYWLIIGAVITWIISFVSNAKAAP
jgi:hypothetical protein